MTTDTAPSCPLTGSESGEAECAQRLILSGCLERWHKEAVPGVVDTGRYRCRYVVWGRGPTLVLLPGMGMDALGFVMVMARLQSQFRCVSYDYPDGENDGARLRRYQHADLVADLFALLDQLQIRQCDLLGSSFGSTIALTALREQPQRFGRAIVQGGFAHKPLAGAEVLAASFARFLPGRVGHVPFARSVLEHNFRASFRVREPEVWDFFVEHNLRLPLQAFAARALILRSLDLRPILPGITQPVLMLCGDRDPVIGKTCEQELKAGIPILSRAEIEPCGHFPQLTHPEVMAEVVRQFCGTNEPGA